MNSLIAIWIFFFLNFDSSNNFKHFCLEEKNWELEYVVCKILGENNLKPVWLSYKSSSLNWSCLIDWLFIQFCNLEKKLFLAGTVSWLFDILGLNG